MLGRTPIQWFGNGLLVTICVLALWRGGRRERITAATLLVGNFAGRFLIDYVGRGPQVSPQLGLLAMDGAMLAVLLWVALSSRKLWPLPAAACQLLVVAGHLAFMTAGRGFGFAYITALIVFSYGVMLSLGAGALFEPGEERPRPTRVAPPPG